MNLQARPERRIDPQLVDRVHEAAEAESVALDVGEARQRAGLDRANLFRRAAGSASELTTALDRCGPCCGGSPTKALARAASSDAMRTCTSLTSHIAAATCSPLLILQYI